MNWRSRIESIGSRDDFISFVYDLLAYFESEREEWENQTIDAYIDALARWTRDMDGYYKNMGQSPPDQLSWRVLADMLFAATMYE